MPHLTTRALVLREVKFKEADKMLTVLTECDGKLSVRARGAMRKSCTYASAAQLLTFSEMTLFGNRGRWSLDEAQVIERFDGLSQDIELLALGSYFAQLLELLSDEDSPGSAILSLGLNALYALSKGLHSPAHIKAVFELRLMCLSGYEPVLEGCAVCGEVDITNAVLDLTEGTISCAGCRTGGGTAALCADSLAAMRYVTGAESRRVFSFSLTGEAALRFEAACEKYLLTQLDCGFSALDYYKEIKQS